MTFICLRFGVAGSGALTGSGAYTGSDAFTGSGF